MKLILLRHAKSSWTDPVQSDHERPLNARGVISAESIGAWLRATGHMPTKILCSTATRTCETRELIGFGDVQTVFSDSLYNASEGFLRRAIEQVTDAECLMVIGHNPGLGTLALQMAGTAFQDDALYAFPTGACLVMEGGVPIDFTVPRRLLEPR
jgi:phosphohistidine phosphatase